ncbi:hypothetical protein R3P38DRAFT_2802011 [Favolaschia claudopus]|uniref:Uncharacterized protein n=1 Tax=Favolaschia claudopus TaxID=2862362 RepID=A0AAV9ZVD3_9AGAR
MSQTENREVDTQNIHCQEFLFARRRESDAKQLELSSVHRTSRELNQVSRFLTANRLEMGSPQFNTEVAAPTVHTQALPWQITGHPSHPATLVDRRSLRPRYPIPSPSKEQTDVYNWIPTGEGLVREYENEVQAIENALEHAEGLVREYENEVQTIKNALEHAKVKLRVLEVYSGKDRVLCATHTPRSFGAMDRNISPMLRSRRRMWMLTETSAASLWNPLDIRAATGPISEKRMTLKYVTNSNILDVILSTAQDEIDLGLLTDVFFGRRIKNIRRLAIYNLYSATGSLVRHTFSQSAPIPSIRELYIVGVAWSMGKHPCTGTFPVWAKNMLSEHVEPEIHVDRGLLALTLIQCIEPDRRIHVPWSSLKLAEGGFIPTRHLRQLSSITKLSLGGVFLPAIADGGLVELVNLIDFEYIVPWKWRPGTTTFEAMKFPNLECLRLQGSLRQTEFLLEASDRFHHDLSFFLQRCTSLTTLELTLQVPYSTSVLITHLRSCPSLVRLEIGACPIDAVNNSLFRELCDTTILPNLKFLRVAEGRYPRTEPSVLDEADSAREIISMMDSRFRSQLRLWTSNASMKTGTSGNGVYENGNLIGYRLGTPPCKSRLTLNGTSLTTHAWPSNSTRQATKRTASSA